MHFVPLVAAVAVAAHHLTPALSLEETVDKLEWNPVTPAKAGVQRRMRVQNAGVPALDPGFRRGDVQTETRCQRKSTASKRTGGACHPYQGGEGVAEQRARLIDRATQAPHSVRRSGSCESLSCRNSDRLRRWWPAGLAREESPPSAGYGRRVRGADQLERGNNLGRRRRDPAHEAVLHVSVRARSWITGNEGRRRRIADIILLVTTHTWRSTMAVLRCGCVVAT